MKITLLSLALLIAGFLSAQNFTKKTYLLSDTTRYSAESGYGYDMLPTPGKGNKAPFYYSIQVPDGNYRVL